MRREVFFNEFASSELSSVLEYYSNRSARAVANFQYELDESLRHLRDNAEIGAIFRTRFRWMLINNFPYLLYYGIVNEQVWIFAIAHERRRPGYWIKRTT